MMKRLEGWGFDYSVLVFGNLIVFGTSFLSYWMAVKGLTTKNNSCFFSVGIWKHYAKTFFIGRSGICLYYDE